MRLDNLLVTPPHPRSPLLADAFKRTGLVERTGRGINRMFAEQLRVGRPAPDYGRSSDAHVVAVLPGGPANLSMIKWVLEQENQQGKPFSVSELQVLAEPLRERRSTTQELAQLAQRTETETRNLLARMVERGWIEARGEGKGRSWHLSAAVYRVLNAPAGYVRVRGFRAVAARTNGPAVRGCARTDSANSGSRSLRDRTRSGQPSASPPRQRRKAHPTRGTTRRCIYRAWNMTKALTSRQ